MDVHRTSNRRRIKIGSIWTRKRTSFGRRMDCKLTPNDLVMDAIWTTNGRYIRVFGKERNLIGTSHRPLTDMWRSCSGINVLNWIVSDP